MKTKEFYNEALELVCNIMNVQEKDIFQSNKEMCVDARYILVGNLSDYFTDEEIVRLTGIARSTANKIRNGFRYKMKKFTFRYNYHEVTDAMSKLAGSLWG